jgi:predicted ATP-grasp superfamily ATP-dependent carboligase
MPAWSAVHEAVPRPVVQAMVHGRGVGINTLWNDGEPLVWFCHKRVREIDLRGGRSTAAVSAPCDPRLLDCTRRLLAALRWHGVAMAEFKWDERTDEFWLLEINGRFWGSLPLALAAGVDFPYYLYQLALGETPCPPAAYAEGVFARDAVAEFKHFVKVMAHGRGTRLATLGQSATILHPWKASFNWVADDPEPGRREWLQTLLRAFGRKRSP